MRILALLKEMVSHFAGDKSVYVLHGRNQQTSGQFVEHSGVEEHAGVEESVSQQQGRGQRLPTSVDAGQLRPHDAVAKPEGGRGKLVEYTRVTGCVITCFTIKCIKVNEYAKYNAFLALFIIRQKF